MEEGASMAVRRIVYLGEPVLRQKAAEIEEITDEIVKLAQDLAETMLSADGLGLAAPQIGESRRVIAVRISGPDSEQEEEEPRVAVIINPVITAASEERESGAEGCLSLPTLQGIVERSSGVEVRGIGVDGEEIVVSADGIVARALQHEIDHLDGVVFIDRADPQSLVWLVPDEDEEDGYREEPTTVEEVVERFERISKRRMARAGGGGK